VSHLQHAAAWFVVLTIACTSTRDQEVSRRISAAAEASDVSVVNVPELATFAWDRLIIFPPYTSSSQIEKELGFSWSESDWIEKRDDVALLVFVDQGRVVRFVDHPRGRGDFSKCHRTGGFGRTEAVFHFTRDASGWRTCAIVAR
jgi:hypothetical protein